MTSERAWATFLRLNDRPGDILFEVYSFLGPLVVDIGWRMSWTLTDRILNPYLQGDFAVVTSRLDKGDDVEQQADDMGRTALSLAAWMGSR
jgi:hypothetical protein